MICEICGKSFAKRRKDSKCCSNKCKALKFARQYKARLKARRSLASVSI